MRVCKMVRQLNRTLEPMPVLNPELMYGRLTVDVLYRYLDDVKRLNNVQSSSYSKMKDLNASIDLHV